MVTTRLLHVELYTPNTIVTKNSTTCSTVKVKQLRGRVAKIILILPRTFLAFSGSSPSLLPSTGLLSKWEKKGKFRWRVWSLLMNKVKL